VKCALPCTDFEPNIKSNPPNSMFQSKVLLWSLVIFKVFKLKNLLA
jgi:hypothetical protein